MRKIVQVALQREGFRVQSFESGIALLRCLMQPNAPVPALIILDIVLPQMDDYEVARHLKQKQPYANIPIVMLTRRNGAIDRLKAFLSGARSFVTKPFTTQTITQLAHHYIGIEATSCRECAIIE